MMEPAQMKKQNRRNILHLVVLGVLAAVLLAVFMAVAAVYQFVSTVESLDEDGRAALVLAEHSCNAAVEDWNLRAEAFDHLQQDILLSAAHELKNWQVYQAQSSGNKGGSNQEVEAEGNAALIVPEEMNGTIHQMLHSLRKDLDYELLAVVDREGTMMAQVRSARRMSGLPDTVKIGLMEEMDAEEATAVVTEEGLRWYCVSVGDELLMGGTAAASDQNTAVMTDAVQRIDGLRFGIENCGTVVMVDTDTGTVVSGWNEAKRPELSEEMQKLASLLAGGSDLVEGMDGEYFYSCGTVRVLNYALVAIIEKAPLYSTTKRFVVINVMAFFVVLAAIYLYAVVQLRARWGRGKVRTLRLGRLGYIDVSLLLKMAPVALVGTAAVVLMTFYAQQLLVLSMQSARGTNELVQIQVEEERHRNTKEEIVRETRTDFLTKMAVLNRFLDRDPNYSDNARLSELAASIGMESVDIYGTDYTLRASTSQEGKPIAEGNRSDFDSILSGAAKNDIEELNNGTTGDSYRCEVAVRRTDGSGVVMAVISSKTAAERIQRISGNAALLKYYDTDDEHYLAVNAETKTVEKSDCADWVGLSAAELGLDEKVLVNHYNGYQTIDRNTYYVTAQKSGGKYLLLGVRLTALTIDALDGVGQAGTACLFLLLGLVAAAALCPGVPLPQENPPEGDDPTEWGEQREEGFLEKLRQSWNRTPPEERYSWLLKTMMMVLFLLMILNVAKVTYLSPEEGKNSILAYIVAGDWDYGFNIFALTDIILLFATTSLLCWFCRLALRVVAGFFGRRSETMAHMVEGFITYLFVLGSGLYALRLLGIQPAALATGAGIVGVVIGIGAQSVVGDILTGVFIVLENEFSVGDFIEVGDWLGRVTEIGVRTTKVRNYLGNVKIFNNSSLSGIINHTMENTLVPVLVNISYGADLRRVEELLRESLPAMRERIPQLRREPIYYGVDELGESSVVLRIHAICREEDVRLVRTGMYREIKLLFDENGVEIPFPQIVVHQAEEKKPEEE